MKKILLFAVALMATMTATAQNRLEEVADNMPIQNTAAKLYIEDALTRNAAGAAILEVYIENPEDKDFYDFQFKVALPDGYRVGNAVAYDGLSYETEKMNDETLEMEKVTVITHSVAYQKQTDGSFMFLCKDDVAQHRIGQPTGPVMRITIMQDTEVADGDYTCKVIDPRISQKVIIADSGKETTRTNLLAESEFTLGVVTAVDMVTVNEQLNGRTFDLQGRRVNNAEKGVYIQNGKKVLVK